MQTKRDHLHAYRFATGRLSAALVGGDPGTGEAPLRRASLGVVFGVVIGVLLCGGAAVFGLISPGGNSAWRKADSIVVEEETGTRYLFLGGRLRPTANYASALLALEGHAKVVSVSRNSLAGVPHGAPVGITGAPDSLPRTDDLLPGRWTWCATRGTAGALTLGPGAPGTALPADTRVLLAAPGGKRYVLWHNTRYPVSDRSVVVALGLDVRPAVSVSTQWLAQLPTGGTLSAAHVAGAGGAAPAVGGQDGRIGDLFHSAAGGVEQTYLLRADGLAPVSVTEAALLAARPGGQAPRELDTAAVSAAPASKDRSLLDRLPDLMASGTAYDPTNRPLCLRQWASGTAVHSTVVTGTAPDATTAAATTTTVTMPGGSGMLAAPLPQASDNGEGELYLITDQGVRYRVADDKAVSALGYDDAPVRRLPRDVLALLPGGPVLDTLTATGTAGSPAGTIAQGASGGGGR
ncbi:type VII secretion protein EccB [Streptomyces sp. QTS52]